MLFLIDVVIVVVVLFPFSRCRSICSVVVKIVFVFLDHVVVDIVAELACCDVFSSSCQGDKVAVAFCLSRFLPKTLLLTICTRTFE